jgi:hypothetical protein
MAVLGVTDHRFLGGAGRWRDSGMMGLPTNDRADAFWRADLLEASTGVAAVVREVRPQVLVTYDPNGGSQGVGLITLQIDGHTATRSLTPELRAWKARVEKLPYFAKTYPPHWQAS